MRFSTILRKKNLTEFYVGGGLFLQCNDCGKFWSPNIQPGGKFPRRYWQCPNGCNY